MATPFPVFVERHQQRTYRAAFRVLGERAEALDVTQEALLALYRRGAGLPEARVEGWLVRAATCRALDRLRRRAAARRAQEGLAAQPQAWREGASPVEALARAEEGEHALAALAELPARQREVVALRVLEGLTFPAIAEALEISEGATKVHFSRGLRALRARVRPPAEPTLSGDPP